MASVAHEERSSKSEDHRIWDLLSFILFWVGGMDGEEGENMLVLKDSLLQEQISE